MSDPIDQNNPPSTPPPTLPDPQAMVDAALSPTPATTTTTTTESTMLPPTPPAAPEPSMPTVPPMPEPVAPTLPPAPDPMPAPPSTSVAMGDDTPLAFVTPPPSTTTTTTTTTTQPVDGAAPLPPVPPAPTGSEMPKKKGKGKLLGMLLGFFALLGIGGFGAYWYYYDYRTIPTIAPVDVVGPESCNGCDGGHALVWRNGECVWRARLCGGEEEGEATTGNQAECTGCRGGYNVHWNGSACINGTPCNVNNLNSDASCNNNGGDWCTGTDARGERYSFCAARNGEACYQHAIDAGYTMQIGILKCKQVGSNWVLDSDYYNNNTAPGSQNAAEVMAAYNAIAGTSGVDPCSKTYTPTAGTEKYICKIGVKGEGGQVYDGTGSCTSLNGKKYTGTLGCFCGTVQVDTPNGHQSYSSTCGCNQETTSEGSPSPSPGAPVMACTGLTYTPTTAPVIGSVLTFTCAGSVTPSTAGTLSYKFRTSINNAAPTPLANTTPTTARLTISACGDYKVECQACATLSGVLTCDPIWTGATQ